MNSTIWKFTLPLTGEEFTIDMPVGAEVVHYGAQYDVPCVWAIVDPKAPTRKVRFIFFGTGHEIPQVAPGGQEFRATYPLRGGTLVLHLFERWSPVSRPIGGEQ